MEGGGGGAREGIFTRFRWMFTEPLASMVAVSPRREVTLPRRRTVWLVKESRYWALMRGVASEAMVWGGLDGVGGGIVSMLWGVGGRGGGGAREHVIMMLNMPSLDGF
jgi:hypothetical protein